METTLADTEYSASSSSNRSFKDIWFTYKGRIARIHHLGLVLFWFNVVLLSAFGALYLDIPDQSFLGVALIMLFAIICLFAFINLIMAKIRRLHDMDYSGWWVLLIFVPILGFFWVISIFITPGTQVSNRFGPVPVNPDKKMYVFLVVNLLLPIMFLAMIAFFVRSALVSLPGSASIAIPCECTKSPVPCTLYR